MPLFLFDRHRSKEAKKMVCECTLTEEEIARGEQGCGEDCLNRLLMIEWYVSRQMLESFAPHKHEGTSPLCTYVRLSDFIALA